jgi:hypothetical protein
MAATSLPNVSSACCANCGTRLTEKGYRGFQPTIIGRHAFCNERCSEKWAAVEVVRLEGWLRRIISDTRGMGSSLASLCLNSNQPANWGTSRKS